MNLNKKIIAGTSATLLTLGLTATGAFASTVNTQPTTSTIPTNTKSTIQSQTFHKDFWIQHKEFGKGIRDFGKGHWPHIGNLQLTDEEKTQLSTMTNQQKQDFFKAKRTEQIKQKQAEDIVIDKLLAGQTLTSDEETIRQTIIKDRANRKAQETKRETERQQLEAIKTKQQSGQILTSDEQTLLDSIKNKGSMRKNHIKDKTTDVKDTSVTNIQ